MISVVLLVVASNPSSASTMVLVFPAPHTVDPVAAGPYVAEAASAVIAASCAFVLGPVKATVDFRVVGNVYTLVEASAVGV